MAKIRVVREFLTFLKQEKKFWLAPIVVILVLFGLLLVFTTRWTVIDASKLDNNALNVRTLIEELKIKRGRILADNGKVLAEPEPIKERKGVLPVFDPKKKEKPPVILATFKVSPGISSVLAPLAIT